MTPTQAQIEAAAKAMFEMEQLAGRGATEGDCRVLARAALTAAAEVGEQYVPKDDPRLNEVVGGPKKKPLDAATIERCAWVAEQYDGHPEDYHSVCFGIAAAIRALATEKGKCMHGVPLDDRCDECLIISGGCE